MSKIVVSAFTVSLDGYAAGPEQSKESPLGIGAEELHNWMRPTRMFQRMMKNNGGTEGVDNDFAERSMQNIGAWIMGRNMFTPGRGAWPDDQWKGWWGESPPYHVPVYVLTHHAREPIQMKGGTTFHFVTEGIDVALSKAIEAANGKDIRIGGGASTVVQFLRAGCVDELHVAISPMFLGAGERLFSEVNMPELGFSQAQRTEGQNATHIVLTKSKSPKSEMPS
jgi:dihydrofolate reductase